MGCITDREVELFSKRHELIDTLSEERGSTPEQERRIAQQERERKITKLFHGKAQIGNWRQQMGAHRWDSVTPEGAKEGPQLELPVDPREVAVEAYFAKHSVARDRVLRGDGLRILEQSASVRYVELLQTQRQKVPALKAAIEDLKAGRLQAGWEKLEHFGVIKEVIDEVELRQRAVEQHLEPPKPIESEPRLLCAENTTSPKFYRRRLKTSKAGANVSSLQVRARNWLSARWCYRRPADCEDQINRGSSNRRSGHHCVLLPFDVAQTPRRTRSRLQAQRNQRGSGYSFRHHDRALFWRRGPPGIKKWEMG